jgi:hypothetical protein
MRTGIMVPAGKVIVVGTAGLEEAASWGATSGVGRPSCCWTVAVFWLGCSCAATGKLLRQTAEASKPIANPFLITRLFKIFWLASILIPLWFVQTI